MLKQSLLTIGLFVSLFATPLFAQTTAPTAPAETTQPGSRPARGRMAQGYTAADPATRAKRIADRMTKQLDLDAATSQKVYEAALTRAQQVDAIQKGSDDNRTKAKALKANADDFRTKLQSLLTPDQFTKLESMRRKRGGDRPTDNDDSNR